MMSCQICFLVAIAGHILCGISDCLMIYLPSGQFRFMDMKDGKRLARIFEGMPLRNSLMSMLMGCLAMSLYFWGYLSLCRWMEGYAPRLAFAMTLGCSFFLIFGMAHHLFCGLSEWLYVRLGRTEEARKLVLELFRKTSVTLFVCYMGFLIFGIALFLAVFTGLTPLPRWACVFNILPWMLILFPFHIGGAANWAGVIMFVGLFFLL